MGLKTFVGRIIAAFVLVALVGACQSIGSGVERGRFFAINADLAYLQIEDMSLRNYFGSGDQSWQAALAAGQSGAYHERYTLSGATTRTKIQLNMLPDRWYWTAPTSSYGLQQMLVADFRNVLAEPFSISDVTLLSSHYARVLYGGFPQGDEQCIGFLIASAAGGIPTQFRNMIVGVTCSTKGQLDEARVVDMIHTLRFDPAFHHGGGFSAETAEFIKRNTP